MKLNYYILVFVMMLVVKSTYAQESIPEVILTNPNYSITNWIISAPRTDVSGYRYYFNNMLLSDKNRKQILFVAPDSMFNSYIDPIVYGQDMRFLIKFSYNHSGNYIKADLYQYDKHNGTVGDLKLTIYSNSHPSFVRNRLEDILFKHIIKNNLTDYRSFYVNHFYGFINLPNSKLDFVSGEHDFMTESQVAVTDVIDTNSGKCIFIDKLLQSTQTSVYALMSDRPEFAAFFNLIRDVPVDYSNKIFVKQGVDFRVAFFGAYHYSIYVPTNEAIEQALQSGVIKNWVQINEIEDAALKMAESDKLIRFLRYHFQDNGVFYGDEIEEVYRTATLKTNNNQSFLGTGINKSYQLRVIGGRSSMALTTDNGQTVSVIAPYNLLAKDYVFSRTPEQLKLIQESSLGSFLDTSLIEFSSSVVIHQIDNILQFD